MTNFEPYKDKVWDAVKADERTAFDEACLDLMKKGVDDLFRVGWSISPKKIEDVYDLIDDLSNWCHERWTEAMKCGDAPSEDVSPREGLLLIKKVIQEEIEKKSEAGT